MKTNQILVGMVVTSTQQSAGLGYVVNIEDAAFISVFIKKMLEPFLPDIKVEVESLQILQVVNHGMQMKFFTTCVMVGLMQCTKYTWMMISRLALTQREKLKFQLLRVGFLALSKSKWLSDNQTHSCLQVIGLTCRLNAY